MNPCLQVELGSEFQACQPPELFAGAGLLSREYIFLGII